MGISDVVKGCEVMVVKIVKWDIKMLDKFD